MGDTYPAHSASTKPTMRAWTYSRRGLPQDCLALSTTAPMPTLPTPTSLLIKVSHVALHPGTLILMHLVPMLFRRRPITAETDFSGRVVAVGDAVPHESDSGARSFPIGTAVFGSVPVPRHLQGAGCLAEFVTVEAATVAQKPARLTFDEAAGLAVSGSTALALLDAARLKKGMRVLVYAPCGGVGAFATQLIRDAVGPSGTIVGMCSKEKWECAKELGCDELLDYAAIDGERTCLAVLADQFDVEKGAGFDCVIDCYGSQALWHSCARYLKPGRDHQYVTVGVKFKSYSFISIMTAVVTMVSNALWPTWLGGVNRNYRQVTGVVSTESLERLRGLCDDGIVRTVVGGQWAMEEALTAFNVLVSGHARGKLAIHVQEV